MNVKDRDLQLRKNVLAELEWDPSVDARTIGVSVEGGIVSLTGHAATYAEKMSAENIVKRVHGVAGVANELEVRLPATAERDDVDIARSVVNALDWNAAVPKERISVTVTHGWVTLEGAVEWYFQKRAADDAVRMLLGVRGVTNKVQVTARHARVEDVKEKIEEALRRNADVDAKKIVVITTDGQVTLSGTVRSWVERDDALNAAWSAPGVTKVVDKIRVHA